MGTKVQNYAKREMEREGKRAEMQIFFFEVNCMWQQMRNFAACFMFFYRILVPCNLLFFSL